MVLHQFTEKKLLQKLFFNNFEEEKFSDEKSFEFLRSKLEQIEIFNVLFDIFKPLKNLN